MTIRFKGCSAHNGNYLFLQPNAIGTCGQRTCLCLEIVSSSCNAKTQENTVKCKCGTNVCDAGEYCNAEQNLCSKVFSPEYTYHTVTDETCDHYGYETILLSDVCEEAAIALQLNDKTVTIGSAANEAYPQGCVTKYNNLLLFPYAVGTCNLGSQCLCREIVSSSSQVCDLGEGFFSDLPGLAANGWSGTQTTNSDCQACPGTDLLSSK